jgi:hypothetical protein
MSNTPALTKEGPEGTANQKACAPWSMLITLVLLILGFLLTSALLIAQTLDVHSPAGRPIFEPAALLAKGKALATRPTLRPTTTESEPTTRTSFSKLDDLKKRVLSQTPATKVRWPRLTITGSGNTADGTKGYAIINGQLIHIGERIDQVMLIEVHENDVVVEYNGERKILTDAQQESP